ncbi:MAG: hypothetical protein V3W34_17745, partial [Phycisphaerae bacterium]
LVVSHGKGFPLLIGARKDSRTSTVGWSMGCGSGDYAWGVCQTTKSLRNPRIRIRGLAIEL